MDQVQARMNVNPIQLEAFITEDSVPLRHDLFENVLRTRLRNEQRSRPSPIEVDGVHQAVDSLL
jgi:hypothetical protein